jgi:hypothetical protein
MYMAWTTSAFLIGRALSFLTVTSTVSWGPQCGAANVPAILQAGDGAPMEWTIAESQYTHPESGACSTSSMVYRGRLDRG